MPAKVTIQSGISAGTSHWIEKPVARIGSDPQSDVCLPSADVPAHALTLEFRDGHFRIYNRCNSNVLVGSQVLEPGKATIWPASETLLLNADNALTLELDADPTPMSMASASVPEYDAVEEEDYSAEPELNYDEVANQPPADNSKFMLQLAVTVMCVLGCVALLAREALKDSSSDRRKAPSFTRVVRDAADAKTAPELIQRLQYAESAAIRGNRKTARNRFGQLRDDLVPLRENFVADKRDPELAILDFVEYRLGQLE